MAKLDLAKAYNAKEVEDRVYQKWEESGFFNPDNLVEAKGESFTISMPPPNVTGILHLGHALENALMDIQVRYQRMQGKKALLIPGTDHAAVATQARVEDMLRKKGMNNPRQELGRKALLEKIREYAENSKATIISQIKKLGTSCDWSRLAYTFDEQRSKAVYAIFKKMYQDGLIYKGYRVVNWSTKGQSTCSDDELVYVDQKTTVYTFKYAKDFPITIATTRPETKLGDTAVAVHPDDKRYKKYIGQKFTVDVGAKNPLTITIISDENVDPKYGTGAVGVTPAHSQIDFEMYQNNKDIGLIQVIGTDGKMTANAGKEYQGLGIIEAREKFVNWLKENDLYISEEEIDHNVGTSDRFGDMVESLPMDQWFIDVNKEIPDRNKSLKDLMRESATIGHGGDKNKKINITPDRFHKIYLSWIDKLRDWNISRQIWWGHRIPIWYRGEEKLVSETKPDGDGWVQDEDTLDTWFSSGAWTFSTLGWPNKFEKEYHPTAWMQMGYEILFFWMARMILMSTYILDDIPFKDVYIHGMLRAEDGKKFSKSLGNGFDPLEMIEKYSADALKLSLIKGVTPGNDSKFYEEKVEASRNFVNKLWNISRFILGSIDNVKIVDKQPEAKTLADSWILSRLSEIGKEIKKNLDHYNFSLAVEGLQQFTHDEFADWYLEVAKIEKDKDEILLYLLQNVLKFWHPFCPFITEEIWSNFGSKKMLIIEAWPVIKTKPDQNAIKDFELVKNLIGSIRNLRSENKIEPAKMVKLVIVAGDKEELIKDQIEVIKKLVRAEEIIFAKGGTKPENSVGGNIGGIEFYISLDGLIDVEVEKKRLSKEIVETEKYVKSLEMKLKNKEFVANAPKVVVDKEKEKLASFQEKLAKVREQFEGLK